VAQNKKGATGTYPPRLNKEGSESYGMLLKLKILNGRVGIGASKGIRDIMFVAQQWS